MKRLALALCLCLSTFVNAEDIDVSGLKFAVPAGWKAVEPSSSMRKAQLEIAVAGQDKPVNAVFFHFGGDVESNVTRWKAQLSGEVDVKTEEADAGGKKVTLFKGTGTYTDPFSGQGAQDNYALIGALIPMDDAGPIVIKLAGPKDATLALFEALKVMALSPFKK
ncbi:MAG: hypothetical protein ACOYOF_08675 [Verrucomicrobiaceae bacterium]|jgi:hypothetical protein